jgi:hypothetical protein
MLDRARGISGPLRVRRTAAIPRIQDLQLRTKRPNVGAFTLQPNRAERATLLSLTPGGDTRTTTGVAPAEGYEAS